MRYAGQSLAAGMTGLGAGLMQRRKAAQLKAKENQIKNIFAMHTTKNPATGKIEMDRNAIFGKMVVIDPDKAQSLRNQWLQEDVAKAKIAESPTDDLKVMDDNAKKENIWLSKIEASPNPELVYDQMRQDILKYNPERAKALPAYTPEVVRNMRIKNMDTKNVLDYEKGQREEKEVVSEEQALKAIPGFTPIQGVDITKDSVKAVKKAAADFEGLKKQVQRVKDLYNQVGIEFTGPVAARMRVAIRTIQLQAKEGLFNLGVLNGADLSLLEDIVPNPTKITAGLKKGVEGETIIPQLEELEAYINQRSSEGYKVHGFTKNVGSTGPVKIKNDADWEKLTPGTEYTAPDGTTRIKE
jgi:hypothetical protein